MYGDLKRVLLEAVVILAVGVLIGLSVNYRQIIDAFGGRLPPLNAPAPADDAGPFPAPVDLAGLRAAIAAGSLVVDARIPELYAEGHIPGAVSLPLADYDQDGPAFLARVPKARPLVTYCNGYGCPDSFDLGVKLRRAGYPTVQVFEGGLPAWQAAGLPVKKGKTP